MSINNDVNKIFCIGLSKTGTVSICNALKVLGFRSAHYITLQEFDHYDAVGDSPVPVIYKILDQQYPNSKFILTIRDPEQWVKSFEKHFKQWEIEAKTQKGKTRDDSVLTRYQIYNTFLFDHEKMLEGFHRYHHDVYAYFADRPDDLLVIDITKSPEWQKICDFLNVPIPNCEFPKTNTAEQVEKHLKWSRSYMGRTQAYVQYKLKRLKEILSTLV